MTYVGGRNNKRTAGVMTAKNICLSTLGYVLSVGWHIASVRVERKSISAHSVVGKSVFNCVVIHNITPTVIAHCDSLVDSWPQVNAQLI